LIDTIKINQIIWIGDDEAQLILNDGSHECRAFCHPCDFREGEIVSNRLNVLDAVDVRVSNDSEPEIEQLKSSSGLCHRIVALVIDLNESSLQKTGAVAVGPFEFQGIPFPGDVRKDDLVEFEVSRLDVY